MMLQLKTEQYFNLLPGLLLIVGGLVSLSSKRCSAEQHGASERQEQIEGGADNEGKILLKRK
jgi:hypothetical protein